MPDESILKASRRKKPWLVSAMGVNFVAIGLGATGLSLSVLTGDDIWFLSTGEHLFFGFRLYGLYLPLAVLSAVFCAVTFFCGDLSCRN